MATFRIAYNAASPPTGYSGPYRIEMRYWWSWWFNATHAATLYVDVSFPTEREARVALQQIRETLRLRRAKTQRWTPVE